MPAFVPGLPAPEVACNLRESLSELDRARDTVALWFTDILERKLWRDLGHSSVYQFAAVDLGFSRRKTAAFLRIARSMDTLPALKKAVASGEVEWSKANVVARVATAETQEQWVTEAKTHGRRELERRAKQAEQVTRAAATKSHTDELQLLPKPRSTDAQVPPHPRQVTPPPAAVGVTLRFTPDQLARFETVREQIAKDGETLSLEDAVLLGLELTQAGHGKSAHSPRGSASLTKVVVQECPSCFEATIPTGRGDLRVDSLTLERLRCEAVEERVGHRNRRPLRETRRREALRRDGHRCRGAGCGNRLFLEVHHRVTRARGGSNRLENLVTLCSGCHAALHRHPISGVAVIRNAQPVAQRAAQPAPQRVAQPEHLRRARPRSIAGETR